MKSLSLICLLLVGKFVSAIFRPDEIIPRLEQAEQSVKDYHASALEQFATLRKSADQLSSDYFNRALTTITDNIKSVSTADTNVRAELNAETQAVCIVNLQDGVDRLIENGGYAISNCIELKDVNSLNVSADLYEAFDRFERQVNVLPQIVFNALIGRNVFTDLDAIIARIQEQLTERQSTFDATFTTIADLIAAFTAAWNSENDFVKSCYDDVDVSMLSGTSAVQASIPICVKFSGRGARFAGINADDFFPQLRR